MTQSELPPSMLCEAAVLLHEEEEEEEEGGRFKSQRGFFSTQGGGRGEEGGGIGEGKYSWRVWKKKKGGRETEGARDWLPLPAPSHLTASLSSQPIRSRCCV